MSNSKSTLGELPELSLRIDFAPAHLDGQRIRIGPGKIALLEQIAAEGSISGGARALKMSYKRAWDLVEEINKLIGKPVLATQSGGKRGGGAQLTPVGQTLVFRYRTVERAAKNAAEEQLRLLQADIRQA